MFAGLFSTKFAVRAKGVQRYFSFTNESTVIVAGHMRRNQNSIDELINRIQNKIDALKENENELLMGKFKFIIREDLDTCFQDLANYLKEY
jgi:hypothetical protein